NLMRQLNEETITLALQPLLAPLSQKYAENASVCAYLQGMQVYLLKTVVEQLVDDSKPDAEARKLLEEQYCPSLVVGHPMNAGAPI
ncbi:AAA family ATPase, partial [Glaciimonas sp. Cout2]